MSNGTESRGKSKHWHHISAKECFMLAGNITTTVNKGSRSGKWAVYFFRCLWVSMLQDNLWSATTVTRKIMIIPCLYLRFFFPNVFTWFCGKWPSWKTEVASRASCEPKYSYFQMQSINQSIISCTVSNGNNYYYSYFYCGKAKE